MSTTCGMECKKDHPCEFARRRGTDSRIRNQLYATTPAVWTPNELRHCVCGKATGSSPPRAHATSLASRNPEAVRNAWSHTSDNETRVFVYMHDDSVRLLLLPSNMKHGMPRCSTAGIALSSRRHADAAVWVAAVFPRLCCVTVSRASIFASVVEYTRHHVIGAMSRAWVTRLSPVRVCLTRSAI